MEQNETYLYKSYYIDIYVDSSILYVVYLYTTSGVSIDVIEEKIGLFKENGQAGSKKGHTERMQKGHTKYKVSLQLWEGDPQRGEKVE